MSRRWMGLVLIGAMLVLALWALPQLPERIPSHWNAQGEVDDWSGRWVVLLNPGIALVTWLLMPLLRRIDPRASNYAQFEPTFWIIVNMIVGFMAIVQVMLIGVVLGWPLPAFDRMMMGVVGLLLVVLGNYLPRVRSNWWLGVRTPWTLSSERVWRSTHRLAGRTFVLGGLVVLAATLLPDDVRPWTIMCAIAMSALVPAVWSYVEWRREQREAA